MLKKCISKQGTTELHYAALRGEVEAVKRLLSTSSVNINSRADVSVHWIAIHIVLFFSNNELREGEKG